MLKSLQATADSLARLGDWMMGEPLQFLATMVLVALLASVVVIPVLVAFAIHPLFGIFFCGALTWIAAALYGAYLEHEDES